MRILRLHDWTKTILGRILFIFSFSSLLSDLFFSPSSGSIKHQRADYPSAQTAAAVCGEAQQGGSFPHGCWNCRFQDGLLEQANNFQCRAKLQLGISRPECLI